MLNKRDKERFRSALKDLKDYEIYKEVMETAMIKLQSELEAHVNENSVSLIQRIRGFSSFPYLLYYLHLHPEPEESPPPRGATSSATQKVSKHSHLSE